MENLILKDTAPMIIESEPSVSEMYHLSPWVWQSDDGYGLLLRVVPKSDDPKQKISSVCLGESTDGLSFAVETQPVLAPGPDDYDLDGCEDPTQVLVDGRRYVYYSGWNQAREEGQMLLAVGPDSGPLEKQGIRLSASDDCCNPKEATIVLLMDGTWRLLFEYSEGGASKIGMASAPAVDGPWTIGKPPFSARPGHWDAWHLSTGPMLMANPQRPVMIYNGANKETHWRIGWVAFNADLTEVVARSDGPLITPPPPTGDESDIAFAASTVEQEDGETVWLYYSVADKKLLRATISRVKN